MSIVDDLARTGNKRDQYIRDKNAQRLERQFRRWLGEDFAKAIELRIEDGIVKFSWVDDIYAVLGGSKGFISSFWWIGRPDWEDSFLLDDQENLAQNLKRGPAHWRTPEREDF